MKQLYLKVQRDIMSLENVHKYTCDQRNDLVTLKKKAKKEKDADTVDECNRKLQMADENLVNLTAKIQAKEAEFDKLKHQLGRIRLNCYVFADIIYNSLIEYEDFLKKYVLNAEDDSDTLSNLHKAIDGFKSLPFEMANGGDYTNNLYNVITDRFIERWKEIRDGVIVEVLREVDNEEQNR